MVNLLSLQVIDGAVEIRITIIVLTDPVEPCHCFVVPHNADEVGSRCLAGEQWQISTVRRHHDRLVLIENLDEPPALHHIVGVLSVGGVHVYRLTGTSRLLSLVAPASAVYLSR